MLGDRKGRLNPLTTSRCDFRKGRENNSLAPSAAQVLVDKGGTLQTTLYLRSDDLAIAALYHSAIAWFGALQPGRPR